jgi:putative ABC transport system ATP-binding protein
MTAGYASSGLTPSPAVRLVPRMTTRGRAAVVAPAVVASLDCVAGVGAAGGGPSAAPPHAISPSTTPIPSRFVMLVARNLSKEFTSGTHRLSVLRGVSFDIPDGAFVAIVGPSGSGKTTLLGLLAGLDTPSGGQVLLDDAPLHALSEDARARVRGDKVGFVFQSFQLIPTLTALENVQVPLELRGDRGAADRARALLDRVGLAARLDHYPTQLSGGEQQRVAIARAFANRPKVLFADEPTGNLDGATGDRIVALLEELNRDEGTTIVLVTHDATLAERTQRVIRLRDGELVEDRATVLS